MNKVTFLHCRAGNMFSGMSSYGGMTLALRAEDNGSTTVAVARCHPGDRYVKKIGRLKAEGRLNATCEVTKKKFVRVLPMKLDDVVESVSVAGISVDSLLGQDRFARG